MIIPIILVFALLVSVFLASKRESLEKLKIPLMVDESNDSNYTAFTVSVDYISGTTTGISAEDRSKTILGLIDKKSDSSMFQKPGHIFPMKYKEGGVLVRAGHTEASVDISKLAKKNSSAVICEIMNEDGTMARYKDLIPFAKKHRLKIAKIEDLISYRLKKEKLIEVLRFMFKPENHSKLDWQNIDSWISAVESSETEEDLHINFKSFIRYYNL